jgi:hypothetical protein
MLHTADPSPFEVEIAIAKFKKHKSPDSDQISAVLIQAGAETLRSEIHKVNNSIWIKEQSTRRAINLTVVIWEAYRCYRLNSHKFSIRRRNYWGSSVWVST